MQQGWCSLSSLLILLVLVAAAAAASSNFILNYTPAKFKLNIKQISREAIAILRKGVLGEGDGPPMKWRKVAQANTALRVAAADFPLRFRNTGSRAGGAIRQRELSV